MTSNCSDTFNRKEAGKATRSSKMTGNCRLLSTGLTLLLMYVAAPAHPADSDEPEVRTWTDANEEFQIEATLLEITKEAVRLRKTDGQEITVPLDKLSFKDRLFLHKKSTNETETDDERIIVGLEGVQIDEKLKRAMMTTATLPPSAKGMLVSKVNPRSSAGLAGIKKLDVILSVGGKTFDDIDTVGKWFQEQAEVGEVYPVEVLRMTSSDAGKISWLPQTIHMAALSGEMIKDPRLRAAAQQKAIALEKRERSPISFVRVRLGRNSIDQTTVALEVKNVSQQNVLAYKANVYCYNRFDEPIGGLLDQNNRQPVISQNTVKPGETEGGNSWWTLQFRDGTAKVKAILTEVKMADGSVWEPKEGREVSMWGERKQ